MARPKANSSPRLINQSMTFNVDYASTPKKNQPRASTPSRRRITTMSTSFTKKKTIPPPLLSSSIMRSPLIQYEQKKRKQCCCCCSNERRKVSCTASGIEKRVIKKQRQKRRTSYDNIQHNVNAKYPIRFMLDRRAQDIDRCNPIEDALIFCDFKPFLKSYYTPLGDYNVWIL